MGRTLKRVGSGFLSRTGKVFHVRTSMNGCSKVLFFVENFESIRSRSVLRNLEVPIYKHSDTDEAGKRSLEHIGSGLFSRNKQSFTICFDVEGGSSVFFLVRDFDTLRQYPLYQVPIFEDRPRAEYLRGDKPLLSGSEQLRFDRVSAVVRS